MMLIFHIPENAGLNGTTNNALRDFRRDRIAQRRLQSLYD